MKDSIKFIYITGNNSANRKYSGTQHQEPDHLCRKTGRAYCTLCAIRSATIQSVQYQFDCFDMIGETHKYLYNFGSM